MCCKCFLHTLHLWFHLWENVMCLYDSLLATSLHKPAAPIRMVLFVSLHVHFVRTWRIWDGKQSIHTRFMYVINNITVSPSMIMEQKGRTATQQHHGVIYSRNPHRFYPRGDEERVAQLKINIHMQYWVNCNGACENYSKQTEKSEQLAAGNFFTSLFTLS